MKLARITVFLPAVLLLAHTHAVGSDYSNTYASTSTHGPNPPVYKFIDSAGKVIYSSSLPDDFVHAEEMTIEADPAEARVEDARQRHHRISERVQELSQARAKREQALAELEMQRLERLALMQQGKPQRVYQTTAVITRPRNHWQKWHYGGGHHHRQPVNPPSKGRPPGHMPLPRSSFPDMF